MTYIKRDLEDKIMALSKEYSCILIEFSGNNTIASYFSLDKQPCLC